MAATQLFSRLGKLLDVALTEPIADGSFIVYDLGTEKWETVGSTGTGDVVRVGSASLNPTRTFADNSARTAAVPDFVGQIGVQLDTFALYRSNGTLAGNWTAAWVFGITTIDGLVSNGSISLESLVGTGFVQLLPQSPIPSAPASGVRIYGTTVGFNVINAAGRAATLDISGLSASRNFALPDAAGTLALTSNLTGYVTGPGSATDNAIVVYDGATGKLVKNSNITIEAGTTFAIEFTDSGFATDEVTISVTGAGKNVLALWNKSALGFSALTFRESGGEERGAIGYSQPDNVTYFESSNPDATPAPDMRFFFTDTGGSDTRLKLYESGRSAFFIVEDQANPALNIAATTGVASFTYQSGFGVHVRSLDASGYSMIRLMDETDAEAGAFGHANADNRNFLRYVGEFQIIGDTNTTTLSATGAFGFADGVRQTFNPNATNAGINVGSFAGDPSSPSNGDLWYDSTANELTARINGANVALGAGGGGTTINSIANGRLTLATGNPVPITTISGAGTLYFTPYKGNQIALYDGATTWNLRSFSELSITLSTLDASTLYDVFAYDNAGTVALETTAWASTTARATALTLQDGVFVRSGATTRRYLGTIATDGSEQCSVNFGGSADGGTAGRCDIWNFNNREPIAFCVRDTTNSWAWTTLGWQQANASAGNQVVLVLGFSSPVRANVNHNAGGTVNVRLTGVGIDSTSALASFCTTFTAPPGGTAITGLTAAFDGLVDLGQHQVAWIEHGNGSVTFYGDNNVTYVRSGMTVRSEY